MNPRNVFAQRAGLPTGPMTTGPGSLMRPGIAPQRMPMVQPPVPGTQPVIAPEGPGMVPPGIVPPQSMPPQTMQPGLTMPVRPGMQPPMMRQPMNTNQNFLRQRMGLM